MIQSSITNIPLKHYWDKTGQQYYLAWKSQAQKEMEAKGITAVPVWRFGEDPGKLIADAARELGVSTVMIGTTKRSALINLLRGDVLRTLARNLPSECHLVISG